MDKGLKLAFYYTTIISGLFIFIMILAWIAEKRYQRTINREENRGKKELMHERMSELIRNAHVTFDSCSAIFRENDLRMIERGLIGSTEYDTQI